MDKNIKDAIKCGYIPKMRPYQNIVDYPKTRGEMVVAFAHHHLITPEGSLVGQPLRLEPFQIAFILAVFDNPHQTRHAYMSVARRNGKTFLTSVILLAYIVGGLAIENSFVASAALSRDQAALAFRLMANMLMMSPDLEGLFKITPSSKQIIGLAKNVQYRALSSDAKTGHGQSLRVILLDEAGQITGEGNDFIDMLTTSQGSYDDALFLTISTQSASDSDYLSIMLDAAERDQPDNVVSHVYKADEDCDLLDKKQWYKANPGLGKFRSLKDMEEQMKEAARLPSKENGARNLLLNNRVAMEQIWLAPQVWKDNNGAIDESVFANGVHIGLDLSKKNDLTCACIASKDEDGIIHVKPFAFTPMSGIEERSRADRVPYDVWVRDGLMTAVPGETIDYEWVAMFLKQHLQDEGINTLTVNFDRWRIDEFHAACDRVGYQPEVWENVGQGYQSISPRMEALETALLQKKIRHGSHPLLNLGASNAIRVQDPAGNSKLDKSKSSQKIDTLIAMLMAVYPLINEKADLDIMGMVG